MLRIEAYVLCGMWVADCPRPYCGNVERLNRIGQRVFECTAVDCQLVGALWWHPDSPAIWQELLRRPMHKTRNWAPAGHRQAIECGVPQGQTVDELRAEFAMYDPTSYAVAELRDLGLGWAVHEFGGVPLLDSELIVAELTARGPRRELPSGN